jgi:hypothetical protein
MARMVGSIAALVLALALMGCAAQDPEPGQLAVVADRTAQADTARMTMTMSMTMPGFGGGEGGEFVVRSEGVVDLAGEAFQATIEQVDASGGGLFGTQAPEVSGEVVVIDGFQYQRGELGRQLQPDLPADRWLRTPVPEGAQGGLLPGAGGQQSPMELIAQLGDLGGTVTNEGRDEVRGAAVTRWRVEASIRDLMEAQGTPEQAEVMGGQMDAVPVLIEVWADEGDLLRRMRIDTDLTAFLVDMGGMEEGEARSVIDLELYDFGVEAAISAPPEDLVWDFDPALADFDSGFDVDGGFVDEATASSPAAPAGPTSHAPGAPVAGARDVLAQLPYPDGAERIEVSSSRLVYAVPARGERPVEDLMAFYAQQLPFHQWSQTGEGAADGEGWDDGPEVGLLWIEGHSRTASIEIADDGTGELLVSITLD